MPSDFALYREAVREWSTEHLTQRHDESVLIADCLISVGAAA
jgi:hypothetical protein